ncbi:peroxisomal membrane protein 11A isoform 2-T2 [Thomomys bottae]
MLLRYLLESKAGREKVVMKLKKLESSVSAGRKWFRLGNVVHAVQATEQSLRATHPVPRLCLTLANLNRVVYFICDTVLWARSVGLASRVSRERWQLRAARHYCCFLLLCLLRDAYEMALQMARASDRRARRGRPSEEALGWQAGEEEKEWLQSSLLLLFQSLKQHPPLLLDTVKNFCDILIPLNQLGIYRSNPGIIGLGGLVSSVAGIITIVFPQMKLRTP